MKEKERELTIVYAQIEQARQLTSELHERILKLHETKEKIQSELENSPENKLKKGALYYMNIRDSDNNPHYFLHQYYAFDAYTGLNAVGEWFTPTCHFGAKVQEEYIDTYIECEPSALPDDILKTYIDYARESDLPIPHKDSNQ